MMPKNMGGKEGLVLGRPGGTTQVNDYVELALIPEEFFFCTLFRGLNPGLLRLRHWQSYALITRLDAIHKRLDLIHE